VKIAVISAHTCPLAALGGKETGGMNVYVRETCRELGRQGVEVDIFTRSQNSKIPRVVRLERGVRVFHIPAGPEAPYDKYCLIEHLGEFLGGILRYSHGGYDLIHSHYWISGVVALELRERWRAPIVHMYHTLGFLKNRVARTRGEHERTIRIQWEWEVARRVDALVASHPLERALLIWHYDAIPDRVKVIPCGVDLSLFRPINRERAYEALCLEPRAWLLFVGRLEPIKGLDTLLKAIELLKRQEEDELGRPALLIIGGNKARADVSGLEGELQEQVTGMGLQQSVFLMGSKPQVELPLYYSASEACILPSRYESFGMVALEAMACGRPVIASRVGGLSYTVRDGETGFLIPEGDAETLSNKIGILLSDSNLRRQLGKNALKHAREFQWEKIVASLLGLYRDLLLKHGNGASFLRNPLALMEKVLGP
jgi:D-inositol-3-phosphate glycosyltransferase